MLLYARQSSSRMVQPRPPCFNTRAEAELPMSREDPFCPQWPLYRNTSGLAKLWLVERAARQWVERVVEQRAEQRSASKLTNKMIEEIMATRCAQRLCLHVQIIQRRLYIVAPQSRKCAVSTSSVCTQAARQTTIGVAMSVGLERGKWDAQYSPTPLEWHFAAGLNFSSCAAAVTPGDFNGAFSRLRLLTWLRLLEEAAQQGMEDTELVICAGETPLTAGGWCLHGAQPVFEAVANEASATLPLPHWLPRLRDADFSVWDAVRRAQGSEKVDYSASQERKAVFRGGVYRLSVYSDRWRERGVRRTVITPANWRRVGRTALLPILSNQSARPFLNAHVGLGPYAERLGVGHGASSAMDNPASMSLAEQQRLFRYVLNLEGHGGWADRLYRLLLSQQLVLMQDVAPRLWFERLLEHGMTHLVVDSNLRNLTEVVRWARANEPEVSAMISRANRIIGEVTSVAGIRAYVWELLQHYTAQFIFHVPQRHARAIRFKCAPLPDQRRRTCRLPREANHLLNLQAVRCGLRVDGTWFDTLHDAGVAARLDAAAASTAASATPSPLPLPSHERLHATLCSDTSVRVNARAQGRWCFDFLDPASCARHYVPVAGRSGAQSGCARRLCVWSADLEHATDKAGLPMCQVSRTMATFALQLSPACLAACCTCNRSRAASSP